MSPAAGVAAPSPAHAAASSASATASSSSSTNNALLILFGQRHPQRICQLSEGLWPPRPTMRPDQALQQQCARKPVWHAASSPTVQLRTQ